MRRCLFVLLIYVTLLAVGSLVHESLQYTARTAAQQAASALWQLPLDAPQAATDKTQAVRSCESIVGTKLTEISHVHAARVVAGTSGSPDWCRVTIRVVRPPAPNIVTVWVGLPLEDWNGRFLGLGGSGFQAGSPQGLAFATALGFAAAATDAGHPLEAVSGMNAETSVFDGSFALDPHGRLDWNAVRNFAYLGIHDMTTTGKAVTSEFYGVSPRYSYFSGCSTGGRQGQSEVQRFPDDYDGVLSGAPAIYWTHIIPGAMWPQVVMNDIHPVAQCKFEAARRSAIAACDADDAVRDYVISEPLRCTYDPGPLVGMNTECGDIGERDAEVIRKIWDGPRRRDGSRLWYGLNRGATFDFVAMTDGTPLRGRPNEIVNSWFKYFLKQDPNWSSSSLSPSGFELLFDQSVDEFGDVFDTARTDIGAFADRGGKAIIWHGTVDNNFPAAGTIQYVDRIRHRLGARRTDQFLRFYLVPGVAHCVGGEGAQPMKLLTTLMDWVERGRTPAALIAEKRSERGERLQTRLLCPYPSRARYHGRGSNDDAQNYSCGR
jgi:Tannase and feruloyl esterase